MDASGFLLTAPVSGALTKSELVGIGPNGQEQIEIGNNLTLVDGVLSANGGGSGGNVSPTLNLMNDDLTVRTSLTAEEIENIGKGLYNSVLYVDDSLGDDAAASLYFPENAIFALGEFIFSIYKVAIKETGSTISASIVGSYVYELLPDREAAADGTYPITINRVVEASRGGGDSSGGSSGGGSSGGSSGASGSGVNFLQATLDEPDVWGYFEGTYTGTIDPHKVNVAILPDPKNKYTMLTKITDEGVGSATIITDRQPVTLSFANNEIHRSPAGTYFHFIHVQNYTVNIDFNYYSTYGRRYRSFETLKNDLQDKIISCSGFVRINNKAKNARAINLRNNTIEYFDNDTAENASIDLTGEISVGDQVFSVETGMEVDNFDPGPL